MATIPHYEVGGTLHLVVNNHLGFTAQAEQGRLGYRGSLSSHGVHPGRRTIVVMWGK